MRSGNKLIRVESHIYKNNKDLDKLCFLSKNLYNVALYHFRQELLNNNKWVRFVDLYNILKRGHDYKQLPSQVAQQTLRVLDKNIKSYIASIKDYSKNPNKYKGAPRFPKYLDKTEGRFTFINPGQSVSRVDNKLTLLKKSFKFKTGLPEDTKILEIRVVPKNHYHKIEVVYEIDQQKCEHIDSNRYIGIDLGVDNLMAITTLDNNRTHACEDDATRNQLGVEVNAEDDTLSDVSILVKGRLIKSINQFYNKQKASIQRELKTKNNKHWSRKLSYLTLKRNQNIEDYFHKATKEVINTCLEFGIGSIIIGHNKLWKHKVTLGKRTNQNFTQIPFNRLIQMLQYKAEEYGIEVKVVEESYTSITDHLAGEPMKKQKIYLGERIKRGLFKSSTGKLINADLNGAIGILRKVVGDGFLKTLSNRGDVFSPIKLKVS